MSGEERQGDAMVMVSVRVPQDLLDRADKLAVRLASADVLGRAVTRTDVIRAALETGVGAIERRTRRRG
jgi:hypothetical protein